MMLCELRATVDMLIVIVIVKDCVELKLKKLWFFRFGVDVVDLLGFWIRALAVVWFPAKMERFRTTQNNPPAVVPRYLKIDDLYTVGTNIIYFIQPTSPSLFDRWILKQEAAYTFLSWHFHLPATSRYLIAHRQSLSLLFVLCSWSWFHFVIL